MRLWHQSLITRLPKQQLCGQWRECAALLGKGWGRKHSVVDYVFRYNKDKLATYAYEVFKEMLNRGYNPNPDLIAQFGIIKFQSNVYDEHDDTYFQECISNLAGKNIYL